MKDHGATPVRGHARRPGGPAGRDSAAETINPCPSGVQSVPRTRRPAPRIHRTAAPPPRAPGAATASRRKTRFPPCAPHQITGFPADINLSPVSGRVRMLLETGGVRRAGRQRAQGRRTAARDRPLCTARRMEGVLP
ncbi:MAG: hypothetical protein AVDCRST_MAG64-3641 [uncultured Phycisphaerae bacterium]|uniref:Uncharacterized protein n=1 Tax=uncultured Phycisphaerae bacterium TaxID=904963 RepID=A0A6J4Q7N8_9BACT|nr:MAG: hypothetical protein AVDCRST_MAG64-3641 [uncultured Phycisphaerae bacterium]